MPPQTAHLPSPVVSRPLPVGVPLLSFEAAQELVNLNLAARYHSSAGHRMLRHMQQRSLDAPVPQKATALALGAYFPLMAYRAPVHDLAKQLVGMESARSDLGDQRDLYRRQVHILRCAGTPGLGKSTAAEALWPALHTAWQSPEFRSAVADAAGDAGHAEVAKLGLRLLNSLVPERFLVFRLAFNAGKAVSLLACDCFCLVGKYTLTPCVAALHHTPQ